MVVVHSMCEESVTIIGWMCQFYAITNTIPFCFAPDKAQNTKQRRQNAKPVFCSVLYFEFCLATKKLCEFHNNSALT